MCDYGFLRRMIEDGDVTHISDQMRHQLYLIEDTINNQTKKSEPRPKLPSRTIDISESFDELTK